MRARTRAGGWVAGLILAAIAIPSCQWAGDASARKASFAAIRKQVDDVNTRLTSAVSNGEADRVPGLDREMNTALDTALKQSSAMNLLDREHLSIAVATARRCMTDMDRYATSGDMELLRAQAQQLAPTISEIQELLDRAERSTTAQQ
jgi:hypothetical protein